MKLSGERRLSGSFIEVLGAFLRLGLSAFGGPIAHLGYFREEFVLRRRWLSESAYADLVALCQFLPGPASSQVGFGLGLIRAGLPGAAAAWIGFTLPSAGLMIAFAFAAAKLSGPVAQGLIHGLKLVAVAVVAQAVMGMARTLAPDVRRATIAVSAVCIVTLAAAANVSQIAAIAAGAAAGYVLCRGGIEAPPMHLFRLPPMVGWLALGGYLGLLFGLPIAAALTGSPVLARADAFYRSGALVFGGGHVVLPLLKQAVVDPGWVSQDTFLTGYGMAQALPGPLFTFAGFLGASMSTPPNGLTGAALGLAAVFLPGLLALLAVLPFWSGLRQRPAAQAAMRGANAAVVGILAAALYNPVWISTVQAPADFAAALVGLLLLVSFRWPPGVVVILGAASGVARTLLS